MADRRTGWIGAALGAGFAVVLLPPALLFWSAIQPEPWNSNTVKIRFQSVRYEAGGLVFRYSVQNLTHRTARFVADSTQIRALQPADRPEVGYPNLKLPLELAAGGTSRVAAVASRGLGRPDPDGIAAQASRGGARYRFSGFATADAR